MDGLTEKQERDVKRYRPVEAEGVTLWPVRVKENAEFLFARVSLEILQQSFPVRYLTMPILESFYRMDYDAVVEGQKPTGAFSSAVLALLLALRVGEGEEVKDRLKRCKVYTDSGDHAKLRLLSFEKDGETISIKPAQFRAIREVIAAQNGVETYGDDANPDLVEAERTIAEEAASRLRGGIEEKIAFASALLHVDEEDIDEWPILRLERKTNAVRRAIDYAVCAVNEGAGVKWKGGNPVPHPYLERKRESAALQSLETAFGGEAAKAINGA